MKFVKVMGKYVEICRDDYNQNKITFGLESKLSDYEYIQYLTINKFTNYCWYSQARGFVNFSESELVLIEKKFKEFVFEECVCYEEK